MPAVNPVDFTQRGSAISNKMAWSMPFALAGDFCDPTGCVETDRISVKSVTTDPGAATSRANTSVTYFPNHGHFQGAHFQSWVYRGTVNKTGGPGYVNTKTVSSGALTWTIGATASQRGAVIWHGHTMWSRFTPNMQWYRDYARTGNAKCHTTDNVCPY